MNLETVFSLCGSLAMLGWAGLVLLPRFPIVVNHLARWVIPCIIGLVYIYLMASNFSSVPEGGGFGSLAAVKALFTVDALLLGGWVHYLAFDLFVGSWEVEDGRREGIHHLILIPCLLLTFMAGPAGLVLYIAIRYAKRAFMSRPVAAAGGA